MEDERPPSPPQPVPPTAAVTLPTIRWAEEATELDIFQGLSLRELLTSSGENFGRRLKNYAQQLHDLQIYREVRPALSGSSRWLKWCQEEFLPFLAHVDRTWPDVNDEKRRSFLLEQVVLAYDDLCWPGEKVQ